MSTTSPTSQTEEMTENQTDTTIFEMRNNWKNWNKTKTNEDGLVNRIDGALVGVNRGRDKCVCAPDGHVL